MSRVFDLERDRPDATAHSDVCIVGAGAAGIVLAVELLRLGQSVTLLEGGGSEFEDASQDSYRSEVVGLRHLGIHGGRFRAKGGTTTRWGGQILEFDERDFQQRAGVEGSGWPIRKSDLTTSYARALELEGLGDAIRTDDAVWGALGLTMPQFGDLQAYFSRWCPEPNFARLHHDTLEQHAGLTVWLHANAVELVLHGETGAGVRCRTLTGVEATFKATEYVFCLGTIESSRFFLQPRGGELPWNRSGLLGRHFQDHIDSNGAEILPHEPKTFHALFDNVFLGGLKYHPKVRLAAARQQELGTLNVAGTMIFLSDTDETLASIKATAKRILRGRFSEVKTADVGNMALHLPLLLRQTYRYGVEHRAFNPPHAKIMLRVHAEQEPLGSSTITLADTRDSLGLLRTRLDWRISERELDTIRAYVEVASRSLREIGELRPDLDLMGRSAEFLKKCDDSNHHMGGMRMGATEQKGVVDPSLRLYGTKNVYVCSGAVFPTSGHSNPTHTLLALAVRLAKHLS